MKEMIAATIDRKVPKYISPPFIPPSDKTDMTNNSNIIIIIIILAIFTFLALSPDMQNPSCTSFISFILRRCRIPINTRAWTRTDSMDV
jgi:hypothetical protein